jgi:3-methyladenine DNA glycosylase AlkD
MSSNRRQGEGQQHGRPTRIRAQRVSREVLAYLAAQADPDRAESSQRFFKEPVALFGVSAAEQRRLARRLGTRLRPHWTWHQAVELVELLVQEPRLEARAVGFLVLAQFMDELPGAALPRIKSWLAWHSGNWATVDLLAPDVLGALLDRYPDLISEVETWTSSANPWVRRATAVAFVRHARRGKHLGAIYRIARRLCGDEEDLVNKALGWLLREAGRSDPDRLERFLLEQGSNMHRTAVRAAIDRFPEEERRRLLSATRSPCHRRMGS